MLGAGPAVPNFSGFHCVMDPQIKGYREIEVPECSSWAGGFPAQPTLPRETSTLGGAERDLDIHVQTGCQCIGMADNNPFSRPVLAGASKRVTPGKRSGRTQSCRAVLPAKCGVRARAGQHCPPGPRPSAGVATTGPSDQALGER